MGVKNLGQILKNSDGEAVKQVTLSELADRTVALDGFNQIFQFLSSIRDPTGKSLQDREGNVTSHLVGILTRNSSLLQNGINPIYVFDGQSHPLKQKEKQRRRDLTKVAQIEYDKAMQEGDLVKARSFAQRINKLTPEMISDSKTLLDAMGIPWVQAPGEGEAQAAQIVIEGSAWATATQDYDAILFGSPLLVRNLNITGKRNLPGGRTIEIKPEVISLQDLQNGLKLSRSQLIDLGILLGSDFNPDGFHGVGVKTALKWMIKYGSFEEVMANEEKVQSPDTPYEEIREIFANPNVTKNVTIDFSQNFDPEKIRSFLLDQRGFSEERYGRLIDATFREIENRKTQTSIGDWFG